MPLFPIYLKLTGKPCLVVGAGAIAESKIQSLLDAEADVTVVAPEVCEHARAKGTATSATWSPHVIPCFCQLLPEKDAKKGNVCTTLPSHEPTEVDVNPCFTSLYRL